MKKYIFSDTKKQNLIESKQLMNIHQFSLTKFSFFYVDQKCKLTYIVNCWLEYELKKTFFFLNY